MIRDAVPRDERALRAIQRASLASPWPQLLDLGMGGGAQCLVATAPESDEVVGYALALDHEQCYLAELAVSPGHRREGYGSALIEAVTERTSADELLLTARADDAGARGFYESHGFGVVERLPDYYDEEMDTRDGLLLSKSLEE